MNTLSNTERAEVLGMERAFRNLNTERPSATRFRRSSESKQRKRPDRG